MKRHSFVSTKPPAVKDPRIYVGDYVKVSEDFLIKHNFDKDTYGLGIVEEAVHNHMWKDDYRCFKVRWMSMDAERAKIFGTEIWPEAHLVKRSEGEGAVNLSILKDELQAIAKLLKVIHKANEIDGLTTEQVYALRRTYLKVFNRYA
jgi:hypothetical protein